MNKLIFSLVFISTVSARAAIVCNGETTVGPVKITISEEQNSVVVEGAALLKPEVYKTQSTYDGHMTELITAPGLSISYENWYGCIHNAKITTNFRSCDDSVGLIESIEVSQCSGGSASDQICHVN